MGCETDLHRHVRRRRDRAILWRGPRLQRSWNNSYPTYGGASRTYLLPRPGARHRRHGDFRGRHCRTPNWWWSPHRSHPPPTSRYDPAWWHCKVPMKVRGVVENMSTTSTKARSYVSSAKVAAHAYRTATHSLGYEVPLLAQLPLEPELRETGEAGRPAVLTKRARCGRTVSEKHSRILPNR